MTLRSGVDISNVTIIELSVNTLPSVSVYSYKGDDRDDDWSVMPVGNRLLDSTVSLKVSVSRPKFMSRSNPSIIGGVSSGMTLET